MLPAVSIKLKQLSCVRVALNCVHSVGVHYQLSHGFYRSLGTLGSLIQMVSFMILRGRIQLGRNIWHLDHQQSELSDS
jgi:hypothetical protein